MKRLPVAEFLVVVTVAALATGFTYYERNFPTPQEMEWILAPFNFLQAPAFVASALVDGNFHDPPRLLVYVLNFLTYVLLIYLVIGLWRAIWARSK